MNTVLISFFVLLYKREFRIISSVFSLLNISSTSLVMIEASFKDTKILSSYIFLNSNSRAMNMQNPM